MSQQWYTEPYPLGIATGILTAYIVSAIQKLTRLVQEWSRPIVRVRWDSWLGRRLFRASLGVYSRLHEELRDDFEDLQSWLKETTDTDEWLEIYLVARGPRGIRGVIYASLYPEYRSSTFHGPLCFVNCVVANSELTDAKALKVARKLWKRLVKQVCKFTKQPGEVCHFFIELADPVSGPEGGTLSPEDETRRRSQQLEFLRSVSAQKVKLAYRMPDTNNFLEENEVKLMLVHVGPHIAMDLTELLKFVYGFHYFWDFKFGSDETDIGDIARRVDYTKGLIERVSASFEGGIVEIEPI